MSDSDLDLISPEEPWITQDGLVKLTSGHNPNNTKKYQS